MFHIQTGIPPKFRLYIIKEPVQEKASGCDVFAFAPIVPADAFRSVCCIVVFVRSIIAVGVAVIVAESDPGENSAPCPVILQERPVDFAGGIVDAVCDAAAVRVIDGMDSSVELEIRVIRKSLIVQIDVDPQFGFRDLPENCASPLGWTTFIKRLV